MNRYDVVTFDMGSTLVYFHPSEDDLYLEAFRSIRLQPSPDALRQARNAAWSECFADAGCTMFEPSEERDRQVEERLMRCTLAHLGIEALDLPPRLVAEA